MIGATQKLYVLLLNPLYVLTRKLSKDKRNLCLQIICLLIPIYFLMIYRGLMFRYSQLARHVAGLMLLLLLLVFSIDRKQKEAEWRRIVIIPLYLSGMGMIVVSCIHPVGSGFILFALMLILLFPSIALVWNNRKDYHILYDCIAKSIGLIGVIYLIICIVGIINGEIDCSEERFRGTLSHAGNLSEFYTGVYCSGLYLATRNRNNGKRLYIDIAIAGIGLGMTLLGQSRSCILAIALCTMSTALFYYKNLTENIKMSAAKALIILAILCICTTGVINITNLKSADWWLGQNMQEDSSEEKAAAEDQDITDRFSTRGKDLNSFSSNRIVLWKMLMSKLNYIGNDYESTSIKDLTANTGNQLYAHNIFLEVSYRCGVIVGVIFVFFEYATVIVIALYLFNRKRKNSWLLFPIMAVLVFLIESMLGCAGMPFILDSGCYYYLSLAPVFDKSISV